MVGPWPWLHLLKRYFIRKDFELRHLISYLDGGSEKNEDFSTIYYLRIFKKWLRITDLLAELIQVADKFWKANMWKNTTCVFFLYTIELILIINEPQMKQFNEELESFKMR